MIANILLVAVGGFLGSLLRFFIAQKVTIHLFATWIANVSGSIFLAILLRLHLIDILPHALWFLLGIGFCGAYTTFSTFGNETIHLLLEKKYDTAFYYVTSSFFVSISLIILVLVF